MCKMTHIYYGIEVQSHIESASSKPKKSVSLFAILGNGLIVGAHCPWVRFQLPSHFCSLYPPFMPVHTTNTSTRWTTESLCPALTTISEGKPIETNVARDLDLPRMYKVFNHPLRPCSTQSIVYLVDLTILGQLKSLEVAGRQRILGPGLDCAKKSGTYGRNKLFT